MKKNTIATAACAFALVAALGGAVIVSTPRAALANDGSEAAAVACDSHYEGERVTIGEDWGQPVYAEWHKGDSGKWWATFWTYNYTKVWAEPAPAGCGWAFHVYDKNGDFVNVYRCEESSEYGLVGKDGVSSHWQDENGVWY
ncbi:MAG: hypothetical protein IKF14_11610 [Atopobiaceae bacterium]|nr:hypothetical protein [Atopobiaceae bacterium]